MSRRRIHYLRSDLEKAVEELSQMLEEPIETETVRALRQRMVDKTVRIFLSSRGISSRLDMTLVC